MAKLIKTPYEFVEGNKITLICTKQEFEEVVVEIFGEVIYESENEDGTVNVSGLVFEERFEAAFTGEAPANSRYVKLIERLKLRHWDQPEDDGSFIRELTIDRIENSEPQKPSLEKLVSEAKELVKTSSKYTRKKLNYLYWQCKRYAREGGNAGGSLRFYNDLVDAADAISWIYSEGLGDNGYVYNESAFEEAFTKLEALLYKAELWIANPKEYPPVLDGE